MKIVNFFLILITCSSFNLSYGTLNFDYNNTPILSPDRADILIPEENLPSDEGNSIPWIKAGSLKFLAEEIVPEEVIIVSENPKRIKSKEFPIYSNIEEAIEASDEAKLSLIYITGKEGESFEERYYILNSSLNLKSNLILKGEIRNGKNITRLQFTNNKDAIIADGKSNIGIEDLVLNRVKRDFTYEQTGNNSADILAQNLINFDDELFLENDIIPNWTAFVDKNGFIEGDPVVDLSAAIPENALGENPGGGKGTILFDKAKDCWVKGVTSLCARSIHVTINESEHIEIRDSYFSMAYDYGKSGNGYGVNIKNNSSYNLIEANNFISCRHSIVMQNMAHFNVVAYNYSNKIYADLGDIDYEGLSDELNLEKALREQNFGITFHGHTDINHGKDKGFEEGPYGNLLEGNYVESIHLDMFKGDQGENNTIFRNVAYEGGINMWKTLEGTEKQQNFWLNYAETKSVDAEKFSDLTNIFSPFFLTAMAVMYGYSYNELIETIPYAYPFHIAECEAIDKNHFVLANIRMEVSDSEGYYNIKDGDFTNNDLQYAKINNLTAYVNHSDLASETNDSLEIVNSFYNYKSAGGGLCGQGAIDNTKPECVARFENNFGEITWPPVTVNISESNEENLKYADNPAKLRKELGYKTLFAHEDKYNFDFSQIHVQINSASDDIFCSDFELKQNYPNPFNPVTTINFSLATDQEIALNIYNLKGELVRVLADGKYSKGNHKISFDGSKLSSGQYFYKLISDRGCKTRKMLLIK